MNIKAIPLSQARATVLYEIKKRQSSKKLPKGVAKLNIDSCLIERFEESIYWLLYFKIGVKKYFCLVDGQHNSVILIGRGEVFI
jgi:hypothetical protein